MLEQILRKILPYRIVRHDDYMVRFFLWGSRGFTDSNTGRSLRLHHILSSDDDDAFHDHPYDFTSLILWGGYTEHRPHQPSKQYHMFNINKMNKYDYHRLELKKPGWTLVWCGPRKKNWGFWSGNPNDSPIPWQDHKNKGK